MGKHGDLQIKGGEGLGKRERVDVFEGGGGGRW